MSNFKNGDIVVHNNVKYEFISKNPDGSLLVRPCGSKAMINIPSQGVVTESVASGKSIYSGKLLG